MNIEMTNITFSGNARFKNNIATTLAAIQLYQSRIEVNGSFALTDSDIGGGFVTVLSSGNLQGDILISNNSGFQGGGFRFI